VEASVLYYCYLSVLTFYLPDKMDTDEYTPEVTEQGIEIVEQLLNAWVGNGDDVVMNGPDDTSSQLEELRAAVEKFKPQIEANPWLQSMITGL